MPICRVCGQGFGNSHFDGEPWYYVCALCKRAGHRDIERGDIKIDKIDLPILTSDLHSQKISPEEKAIFKSVTIMLENPTSRNKYVRFVDNFFGYCFVSMFLLAGIYWIFTSISKLF